MEAVGAQTSVKVMDGSMGRLCMLNGVPEDSNVWSARGLIEDKYHPIVVDAHATYIKAGARLITTNNYAVQPTYYARIFDYWEERLQRDTEAAARLAVQARVQCGAEKTVRILGCLPPLCESHRPDLSAEFIAAKGPDYVIRTYRTIANALLRGGPVDAFIAETMNSWEEASLALEAVKDLGLPIIISMQGSLRSKSLVAQPATSPDIAAKVLAAKTQGIPIEALGFNCAEPEDTLTALQAIQTSGMADELRSAGIALAAYANCHDRKKVHEVGYDSRHNSKSSQVKVRTDLKDAGYVPWCHAFINAGATYCGGCCGSTPDVIERLAVSVAESPSGA